MGDETGEVSPPRLSLDEILDLTRIGMALLCLRATAPGELLERPGASCIPVTAVLHPTGRARHGQVEHPRACHAPTRQRHGSNPTVGPPPTNPG